MQVTIYALMRGTRSRCERDTLLQYRHTSKLTILQKSILSYMLDAKDLSKLSMDAKDFSKGAGHGNSRYFGVDGCCIV